MSKTKFKSGDLVERIEPNEDGTHDVEMVKRYIGFGLIEFIGGSWFWDSDYRKISPKKVKFNLK